MLEMFDVVVNSVLPLLLDSQGAAYLGAGIAILCAAATSIGQGMAAARAVEAVGRQPEAQGKIMMTMIVGQAMVETSAIYSLIIAFVLSGK